VWDRLVERAGRKAVVAYSWQIPASWDDEHGLEISVAALRDGDRLQVTSERLALWPFSYGDLQADVEAAGLSVTSSSYDATRTSDYALTAERQARARR
jgi:hypothetical protein